MHFGLCLLSQVSGRRCREGYAELLEQARVAEASGFDAVFVTERHPAPASGQYCLQPLPLLAALAVETRTIRLGTSVLVLPLHRAPRLAEEIMTVQAIARGRIILGVGSGFDQQEFVDQGVRFDDRFAELERGLRCLAGTWQEWQRHLPGIQPPPLWLAGTTPAAIRRAARLADAWLPADTAPLTVLRGSYAVYARAMRAHGRDPDAADRPLMREAFVHREAAVARRLLAATVLPRYRAYWDAGDVQLRAEFPGGRFTYEDLEAGRFIVGDAAQCTALIEQLRREVGTTFLILRIPKPEMRHSATLEAIRMFGHTVISSIKTHPS